MRDCGARLHPLNTRGSQRRVQASSATVLQVSQWDSDGCQGDRPAQSRRKAAWGWRSRAPPSVPSGRPVHVPQRHHRLTECARGITDTPAFMSRSLIRPQQEPALFMCPVHTLLLWDGPFLDPTRPTRPSHPPHGAAVWAQAPVLVKHTPTVTEP